MTDKNDKEAFIPFYTPIDIPPPPAPMMKQDLNRLRNAIHNEAGITKEEIRGYVQEAVKSLVDKRVQQLLPDKVSMEKLVDESIRDRGTFFWSESEDKFSSEIVDKVSKILAKKIKVEVKTK